MTTPTQPMRHRQAPRDVCLNLEATRPSTSASSLEFPALAPNVRFLVAVGSKSEVLDSFTSVLRATEEESVRSSRCPKCELIQSQSLTPSLLNSGSRSSGEPQRGNREFGNSEKAIVISNSSDHNDGLALVSIGNIGNESRKGDGRAVDSRHKKAAQHNFVEVGLRAAGEKAVELHKDLKVDIFALRRLAMGAAHMVTVQVDTHGCCI